MRVKVNLLEALMQEQGLEHSTVTHMAERVWKEDQEKEESLLLRIKQAEDKNTKKETFQQGVDLSDELVFEEKAIKNICLKYRLRFLSSSLFKGVIPQEAIFNAKRVEKEYGIQFEAFKVIAPAERFKLKDSLADPILVGIHNGKHVYIHQWGNDMDYWVKWISYPIKDVKALMLTSFAIALLIGAFSPMTFLDNLLGESAPIIAYITLKFHMILVIAAGIFTTAIIAGLLSYKDFSINVWRSKYFN